MTCRQAGRTPLSSPLQERATYRQGPASSFVPWVHGQILHEPALRAAWFLLYRCLCSVHKVLALLGQQNMETQNPGPDGTVILVRRTEGDEMCAVRGLFHVTSAAEGTSSCRGGYVEVWRGAPRGRGLLRGSSRGQRYAQQGQQDTRCCSEPGPGTGTLCLCCGDVGFSPREGAVPGAPRRESPFRSDFHRLLLPAVLGMGCGSKDSQ